MDSINAIEKIEKEIGIKTPKHIKIFIIVYFFIFGFVIAIYASVNMPQPYKIWFLIFVFGGAGIVALMFLYEIFKWLKLKSEYSLVAYMDAEDNTSYVYKKDAIEDVRNYGGKWRKLSKEEKQKGILKLIKEDTNNYLKAPQKKGEYCNFENSVQQPHGKMPKGNQGDE